MNQLMFKSIIKYVSYFVAFVILLRLGYLQILNYDFYKGFVQDQTNGTITININRGDIYDRFYNKLAENELVAYLYTDGTKVKDLTELAQIMGRYGLSLPNRTEQFVNDKRHFIYLARRIDLTIAKEISENLSYIHYGYEYSRHNPQDRLLLDIIGKTNVDNKGISGVEMYFDHIIQGDEVTLNVMKDSAQNSLLYDSPIDIQAKKSYVRLTIDAGLQAQVDAILRDKVDEYQAEAGFVVGLDVKTGDILFMSSAFAPDSEEATNHLEYIKSYPSTYLYEPGSTFKTVTFAYLIEHNLYNENQVVDIGQALTIAGTTIHDSEWHGGSLTEKGVYIESSNIGTSKLVTSVDNQDFYNFIKRFNIGEKDDIMGLYVENGVLRDTLDWSARSKYSISFGQELSTTPLQIASIMATIANNGVRMKPRLVYEYEDKNKTMHQINETGVRVLSDYTAKRMQELMREVVLNGTGRGVKNDVRNSFVSMAGKTGTAQMYDPDTGHYSFKSYAASFAGFFPYEEPRIAMNVVFIHPKNSIFGAYSALPTFKAIAEFVTPMLGLHTKPYYENIKTEKASSVDNIQTK